MSVKLGYIKERVLFLVPKVYSLATLRKIKERQNGVISGINVETGDLEELIGWQDLACDEFDNLRCAYPDESPELERTYGAAITITSKLKKELFNAVKSESGKYSDYASPKTAAVIANHLGNHITVLFQPYMRVKNRVSRAKVSKRVDAHISLEIKSQPYLEQAQAILERVTKGRAVNSEWKTISCALAICTGRRMAEIHHSARFEVIEGNDLEIFFTGQLKGKQRFLTDDGQEYDKSMGKVSKVLAVEYQFKIPILCPPQHAVDALQWLKDHGWRKPDPNNDGRDAADVNASWSRVLNKEASENENFNFYPVITEELKEFFQGKDAKMTYHKFRAFYAAILKNQWAKEGQDLYWVESKLLRALCDRDASVIQTYKKFTIVA